jgi:acetyl esterase/lipase
MATVLERPVSNRESSPSLPQVQKSTQEILTEAVSAAKFMITDVRQRTVSPEKESLIHREDVVVFMAGAQAYADKLQDKGISPEAGRVEGMKHVLCDLIETGDIPLRYKYKRHSEVIFLRMVLQDDIIREIGRNILFAKKR